MQSVEVTSLLDVFNWKHSPANQQLKQYIDCYWYLNKSPEDDTPGFPRLIPNPRAHLIVAPASQQHHYQGEDYCLKAEGSHLLMPCSQFLEMDHQQSVNILGITFRPGAIYSFLKLEPARYRDGLLTELNSQFPWLNMENLLKLQSAGLGNKEQAIAVLDSLFLPLLENLHEDRHSKLVRGAIAY